MIKISMESDTREKLLRLTIILTLIMDTVDLSYNNLYKDEDGVRNMTITTD